MVPNSGGDFRLVSQGNLTAKARLGAVGLHVARNLFMAESETWLQALNCVYITTQISVNCCAASHAVHFVRHIRNFYPGFETRLVGLKCSILFLHMRHAGRRCLGAI